MKRFLQIFLTLAVVFNLGAAGLAQARPCNMPCCEKLKAREAARECEHCGPAASLSTPSMDCCHMQSREEQPPATLNTGSALPDLDIASPAGETTVRFSGASARPSVKHFTGAYESPPIFILNATFIC